MDGEWSFETISQHPFEVSLLVGGFGDPWEAACCCFGLQTTPPLEHAQLGVF